MFEEFNEYLSALPEDNSGSSGKWVGAFRRRDWLVWIEAFPQDGHTEKFMVRLNKNGGPKNPEKVDRLCALFTDLSNKDMKRDLYIVSQVIRTGRMLLNDSKKGPPHVQYRRPYGCAVLAMSDVLQTISELKEEKDFVLKVYT
ncbi:Dedicator of cytokinesis protein 3 [Labeo rohita]|uniref:Dedicator of cytokinesis protein 3 n=1 Tax=Labeo rohita TaxID=84645 RepID=A0ABQ8LHR3_LABRO|nr:Dedicator of cytokinesis protein 3 [Labeo rohita]